MFLSVTFLTIFFCKSWNG